MSKVVTFENKKTIFEF